MSEAMHMKVVYEGRTYILNRYPATYKDMLEQIREKAKVGTESGILFSFLDAEADKIVVADDNDLAKISEISRAENKKYVKVLMEKPHSRKLESNQSTSLTGNQSLSTGTYFDMAAYVEFLKQHLPQVKASFRQSFAHGLPCEECLGEGKISPDNLQCENCNGKGYRPKTKFWKLILELIDYKIRESVLTPLEKQLCKKKDEQSTIFSGLCSDNKERDYRLDIKEQKISSEELPKELPEILSLKKTSSHATPSHNTKPELQKESQPGYRKLSTGKEDVVIHANDSVM